MGSRSPTSWTGSGAANALWCLMLLAAVPWIAVGNEEVDALHAQREALIDPEQVLQSWDPSDRTPCTWFHVTCGPNDTVIRLDLGNFSLSGYLVPQLGELSDLQFLEIWSNNLTGPIPASLGSLSQLVSLELFNNTFTGDIPTALGRLSGLRFLRLQYNNLIGSIPESLTGLDKLQELNLSYNDLSGLIPVTGVFAKFGPSSFEGNPYLHYPSSLTPAPAPSWGL